MTKATLLPAIAALLMAGCSETKPAPPAAQPRAPLAVTTVAAAEHQWPSRYEATGTVRARSTTTLAAKWMGYIREVKVQVGDRVKEGDLLVTLDARDLDANSGRASAAREELRSGIPAAESAIAAAKTSLDLAQSTFRRMNDLYQKKSISDQEFDEASARVKAAQAAFDMAKARRAQIDSSLARAEQEVRSADVARTYAEIRAPFAGVVTAKSADPGSLAVPGAPLVTIERDGYRLEAVVDESHLPAMRAGQAASVELDGVAGTFDLRVTSIDPAVDAATRTAVAKIDLPTTPNLRGGLFGRASFTFGSRPLLTVPADALVTRGQLQSIFVAENGTAHLRLVTAGEKSGSDVEVLSGLSAGEQVIIPVPRELNDGDRIEARR